MKHMNIYAAFLAASLLSCGTKKDDRLENAKTNLVNTNRDLLSLLLKENEISVSQHGRAPYKIEPDLIFDISNSSARVDTAFEMHGPGKRPNRLAIAGIVDGDKHFEISAFDFDNDGMYETREVNRMEKSTGNAADPFLEWNAFAGFDSGGNFYENHDSDFMGLKIRENRNSSVLPHPEAEKLYGSDKITRFLKLKMPKAE